LAPSGYKPEEIAHVRVIKNACHLETLLCLCAKPIGIQTSLGPFFCFSTLLYNIQPYTTTDRILLCISKLRFYTARYVLFQGGKRKTAPTCDVGTQFQLDRVLTSVCSLCNERRLMHHYPSTHHYLFEWPARMRALVGRTSGSEWLLSRTPG